MKLNLSKISFINISAIVVIFSIILTIFIYKFTDNLFQQKIIELKKDYYNTNHALVKNEIKRASQKIDTIKNITYTNNKNIIKEKVEFIHNLLASDSTEDVNTLLSRYTKELDLINWKDKSGYFYIFDKSGKFLYYGGDKKFAQKNIYELTKSNNKFAEFIKNTIPAQENFGSYQWESPDSTSNKLETKYVYVKKDLKHEIYIAVGVYKKNIDKEIRSIIFDTFKNDTYGSKNDGYFWIVGLDNIMYMHPKIKGENIGYLHTLDGKKLTDEIFKKASYKGGYVHYKWINPNTKKESQKISYVQSLKDLDLVIGTGFYTDDLDVLIKEETKKLYKLSSAYLQKVYVVVILLIIITLVIARYLALRIQKMEIDSEEDIYLLEQYRHLLDESSVVSRLDKDGNIIYVNKSFEKVSGYSKDEIMGQSHMVLRHPDTPKSQIQNLWNCISNGDIWKGILKNKRKNGESYYASMTIIPLKNKEGEILRFISSSIDITKHIKNKTKLKNLFKTDSLTGLGNRVSLLNYITKNSNMALALISIDRFKEINDSYSHGVGDNVIREFGNRLFHKFDDKNYFLYRVQADVFAIVNDKKSEEKVKSDIENFMKKFGKEKYEIRDQKFSLTYTCGIASNKKNLFAYTDIALQEAKQKKQKIMIYDSSLKNIEDFKNNIQWVDRLNKAISDDNVVPHFQAIYNYKTGKIEKYEALMRIMEDDKIIYPNDFLDIAKRTKLYPELTYKMVKKVIDKFSTVDCEFSLNLCIEDLMNKELTTYLYEYAESKNVFHKMALEIVESEEMEDNTYISKIIQKFKKKGTKLSIDDFGSGYSNYEYLITLQADYLKIDGSIIKLLATDTRTLDVVKSIVEFARKSNIKIIAEFVSDEKIDKILREIGVDYAQGYFYGKPQDTLL